MQHVLCREASQRIRFLTVNLRVPVPKEVPLVCWALNPSTRTNMTVHKLLMSLNPQQFVDRFCLPWSPSIWPLMGWIKKRRGGEEKRKKKKPTTNNPCTHASEAAETGEGDWTGVNTAKCMISLLLWIISIDLLYLVLQHSLIKAVWNKPVP